MNNIRSTLATVWRIAAPYFRSEDKWAGRGLLAAVIAIELALVAIDVLLNQWSNRFYNALQEKDSGRLSSARSASSACWRPCFIVLAVYQLYLNQWLQIRWRRWLTSHYLGEWLHGANHYRMQLQGDAADNPDQRIADDVKLFVERTLDIGRRTAELDRDAGVRSSSSCGDLSAAAPLHLFGSEFAIPGYLVWGALIYADIRHRADAMDRLAAGQARFPPAAAARPISASTWCGCAKTPSRSRCCRASAPNASGCRSGSATSSTNWYGIMSRTKRLTAFTSSYSQAAVVFPLHSGARRPISPTRSNSAA